jgi:hypothetical protein
MFSLSEVKITAKITTDDAQAQYIYLFIYTRTLPLIKRASWNLPLTPHNTSHLSALTLCVLPFVYALSLTILISTVWVN